MSEQIKKYTARELFELSKPNQATTEQIMAMCKSQADNGNVSTQIWNRYVPPVVIAELMNLGFGVSYGSMPDGQKILTVKWEE